MNRIARIANILCSPDKGTGMIKEINTPINVNKMAIMSSLLAILYNFKAV